MKKLTVIASFIMTSFFGFSQEKLDVNVQITNESSYERGIGTLTAEVKGGVAPYYILWSNGSTDSKLTNVGKKNFIVRVSDSAGNVVEELIIINPTKSTK